MINISPKPALQKLATFSLTSCTFILLSAPNLQAGVALEETEAFEPGWSGYIQLATGYGSSKSLSEVSDNNEKITSYDQKAKSESSVVFMPLWQVGYTFDNGTTQLHIGTPESNIIDGSFLFEVGARQQLPDGTTLSAAWIPRIPIIDDEVWTDPYVLNKTRSKSDRKSQAFRIAAESILGTPLSLKYEYAIVDIDNDQAGSSMYKAGSLSQSERNKLKRDATAHGFGADMLFPISDNFMVEPALTYIIWDADGDANSFDTLKAELTLLYKYKKYSFSSSFSYAKADFDTQNPVFKKTRDDDAYDVTLGLNYDKPFGWEGYSLNFYTSYSKNDSNINYYDSESYAVGTGISLEF